LWEALSGRFIISESEFRICLPDICPPSRAEDSYILIEDNNAHRGDREAARSIAPSSRSRFLLIGALLIAAIIGATVALIWMQRSDTIEAYRTATSNLGNGMAQQTTQAIDSIDRVLREIDGRLAVGSEPERIATAMRTQAVFELLVSLGKGRAVVSGLAVADAHGLIRNSTGIGPSAETDVSNQDFFVHFATGDHRDAFIGPPIRNGVTGKWTAIMSRRIGSAYGAFSGVAIAELSLASIEGFYRGAMPAQRSVSLLRSDGTVLVRFPHREDEIGRKIPDRSEWSAAVRQGGGAYQDTDYFTPTRVVAFARPLKDLPLVVGASVTEAEVLAGWPRQIQWLVLGAAAAIIGAVVLLKHLSRQVDRLEGSRFSLASKNVELETAHSQLEAVLANISLGVCCFGSDRKLIVSNQSYKDIYDLPSEALRPGTPLTKIMDHLFASDRFPRIGRDEYLSSRDEMVESGARQQAVVELTSGQSVLVTHQPMPDGGWIATHEDITARREADRHIHFLAHHDALTGLANRTSFAESLGDAVARLSRYGTSFSVSMIDLDSFKQINDTMGHPAGDQLLRETAMRLKSSLRKTDVVARLGGDEFAIIQASEEDSTEGAAALATRILTRISEPYDIDGKAAFVGASIGIALAPKDAADGNTILKMADLALYEAKNAGGNCFRFVDTLGPATISSRHEPGGQIAVAISSAA
jgi:diguanylate cyclase (GGDEF)-like protein